jgi:hypothetical protein
MAQDKQHEQALQATADSLMAEQHALQKRLQQLTLQYKGDANAVQQLQTGKDPQYWSQPPAQQIVAPAAIMAGLLFADTCTHKQWACNLAQQCPQHRMLL